ncbi:serine-rich adhesin for platelets-like [Ruditapes philippinarum]|uniref:serine-rich adhesin for platelets-like n=1 Tax=Ruditapes philippinarum TaxID=129788 RepID=UPI00295B4B51|nr:serine-rich adhesin for platelets-like [Ruditapes philippinarum]
MILKMCEIIRCYFRFLDHVTVYIFLIIMGLKTGRAQSMITDQLCQGCCETRTHGHLVILADVFVDGECKQSTSSSSMKQATTSRSLSTTGISTQYSASSTNRTSLETTSVSNMEQTSITSSPGVSSSSSAHSSTEMTSISSSPGISSTTAVSSTDPDALSSSSSVSSSSASVSHTILTSTYTASGVSSDNSSTSSTRHASSSSTHENSSSPLPVSSKKSTDRITSSSEIPYSFSLQSTMLDLSSVTISIYSTVFHHASNTISRIRMTTPSFSSIYKTFEVTSPTVFTEKDILQTTKFSSLSPVISSLLPETSTISTIIPDGTFVTSDLTTHAENNVSSENYPESTQETLSSTITLQNTTNNYNTDDKENKIPDWTMSTVQHYSTTFDSNDLTSRVTPSDKITETTPLDLTTNSFLFPEKSAKMSRQSLSTRLRTIHTVLSTTEITREPFVSTTDILTISDKLITGTSDSIQGKTDMFVSTNIHTKRTSTEFPTSSTTVKSLGITFASPTKENEITDITSYITHAYSFISTDHELLTKTEVTTARLAKTTEDSKTTISELYTSITPLPFSNPTISLLPTNSQSSQVIVTDISSVTSLRSDTTGESASSTKVQNKMTDLPSFTTNIPLLGLSTEYITKRAETTGLPSFKTNMNSFGTSTINYLTSAKTDLQKFTTDSPSLGTTTENDLSTVVQKITTIPSLTTNIHMFDITTESNTYTSNLDAKTNLLTFTTNNPTFVTITGSDTFTTIQGEKTLSTFMANITAQVMVTDIGLSTTKQNGTTFLSLFTTNIRPLVTTTDSDTYTTKRGESNRLAVTHDEHSFVSNHHR